MTQSQRSGTKENTLAQGAFGRSYNNQLRDRFWPRGWWILPAFVVGTVFWFGVVVVFIF